jgi:AraC-like DNA-binding protein
MIASIDSPFSLEDAASVAHLSPYHLSRVFRSVTGQTLSRYRTDLRLRLALERIAEHDADLTTAALDAGFSSHSHFTNRFRERFGLAPSAVRREDMAGLLREIRKSMQAAGGGDRRSSARRGRRSAA